ncbi:MAG: hypothetical protein H6724_07975 [Sandaracinus sp.]|nr:hypothetical protein [Sandaracinus sp.]
MSSGDVERAVRIWSRRAKSSRVVIRELAALDASLLTDRSRDAREDLLRFSPTI